MINDGAGNAAMTGASVSMTLIVWKAVDAFPQSSVAVQVLVTIYSPAQSPLVVTSANTRVNALPHASVALAVANDGVAGQLIVDGAGKAAITGAVISCTLIVWNAVDILPQSSVAVQVRVTLYSPAQSPDVVTSLNTRLKALPQPSVADAVAKEGTEGQLIVLTAGSGAITGAVTSCTLIVCEAVDTLPQSSVAVQVRVTLYSPAQSPKVVTSLNSRLKVLPQASVAVAVAKEGVAGQLIVEGIGSDAKTGAVIS